MNATAITSTMTTEELFALPDDGIDRDIIRGELREYPREHSMTRRTHRHNKVISSVSRVLGNWALAPEVGGEVTGGETGVRLRRDPETTVGIDVTYYSAELLKTASLDQAWYEGPPVLAVEVLSPSDTHENVVEKINLYLECGVPIVWILDPDFQTLTVYRSKTAPLMLRIHETLDGHPELPGFSSPVRDFFR